MTEVLNLLHFDTQVTTKVTLLIYENMGKKVVYGKQQKDVCGFFFLPFSLSLQNGSAMPFRISFTCSKIKQFPVPLTSFWHLKIEMNI